MPAVIHTGVLLLAAGQGQRFGGDKRLLAFKGCSLMLYTLDLYIRVFGAAACRVMLRAEDVELMRLVRERGAVACVVAQAGDGMGRSLASGIQLAISDNWRYCVVALADMPYVSVATLEELRGHCAADRSYPAIVPYITSQARREDLQASFVPPVSSWGHPVILGAQLFAEVAKLDADRGARQVLLRHVEEIEFIALTDNGIQADIDYPEDIR